MDPNAAIEIIRSAFARIEKGTESDGNLLGAAWDAMEAFNGLDEWLSRGGFLPTDWNALRR